MRDSYTFYTDRLEKEYRDVFGQVEMYVLSRYADEETREERLGELLDIFLTAQESGKSPESVTGRDLEKFCENFCGDFGAEVPFLFMADWICTIAWFSFITSLIDIICFFADGEVNFYPAILHVPETKDFLSCFIAFIFSVMVVAISKSLTRRMMFRIKKAFVKVIKAFCCIAAVFSFSAAFLLMESVWPVEFSCPEIVILIVAGIYLLCYYRFRKKKKTDKIRFSDLLERDFEKIMPDEMEKKFQKENRKRRKHGKNEITFDEFVEEKEKNWKLEDKIGNWIDVLIPLVLVIWGFVGTYKDGGFSGVFDMLIFIVLMLALESAIIIGMRRVTRASATARKKWLLAYRESKNAEEKE